MFSFWKLSFLAAMFMLLGNMWTNSVFAQADCVPGGNPNLAPAADGWIAHIYQYPVATSIPALNNFPSSGEYKGILREEFLPAGQMNFDTHFGGDENDNDGVNDDQWFRNITDNTCLTRLSHFGAVFKGRFTIPAHGTYKISVTSDDGAVLKINGATVHNTWGRSVFNYNGPSEYYVTRLQGDVLNLEILYFEYTIYNRISFKIERYYGPGVISGDQRISSLNPDPAPFVNVAPAAFENQGAIIYQWYYNDINDTDERTWTPIPNSNSVTYNVPPYDVYPNRFEGTRYYHRRATLGGTTYISNAVEVEICKVTPTDTGVYGVEEWIGYVYDGRANFNEKDFLGRVKEPIKFSQDFGGERVYFPTLVEDGGCSFYTETFTIGYKMKVTLDSGVYNFKVEGDDGFRLSVKDEQGNYWGGKRYIIDDWNNGGKRALSFSEDVIVTQPTLLYFDLEYFEDGFGSFISFEALKDFYIITPLEWGNVWAEACGTDNCLTWETIQEKNTSHFELERSYNGQDWKLFDSSVRAQGNSTELSTYHATDRKVMADRIYYRIKQVDLDGAFAYSDIMRVDNPHYVRSYSPFPNPTTDKIRFFSATEVIRVSLVSHDYLLNKALEVDKLHDDRYEVDLLSLKPGNYVIVVETTDGNRDIFKVMKK